MQPRRTRRPPTDRRDPEPRHPTGRVRRRWPREYDGEAPEGPRVTRRYRREFARQRPAGQRRWGTPAMDALRSSPMRNGLVGLAVVGTAVPIAVNRYQQSLRTDPTHERVSTVEQIARMDDASVSEAWGAMEGERTAASSERDQVVQEKVQEYADFGLTAELAGDIYDMAVEANVDPEIAFGLVRAESSFKNTSTSRVGAVGLTQLMPKTAAWLVPGTSTSELRDPETNLRIGFKYLRDLIDKYDGNEDLALTAYNRGPGTVDRILKRGGNPDNGYAGFVKTGNVGAHKG